MKNILESIGYSIPYFMSFNKMVLKNNIRCVFAKIYILDGLLKYFLHVLRKSRGGGGWFSPHTLTNIYTRFLFRDLYIISLLIKWWQTSENFSPLSQMVFFLRSEKLKSWNFLELPRSFAIRKYFFSNEVKSSPKCSDGAAKCFKRSEIVRRLVLM